MRTTLRRYLPLMWKLLVAILALQLARKYFDHETFLSALGHQGIVVSLVGMWIVNQILISWRLKLLFEHVGCFLSLGVLSRVGFISMLFAGLAPGVVGNDVGKIALLRGSSQTVRLHTVAAGVLIDRLAGLATLILVSFAASIFMPAPQTAGQAAVVRLVQGGGGLLLGGWAMTVFVQHRLSRLPAPKVSGKLSALVTRLRTELLAWKLSWREQVRVAWMGFLGIGILVFAQALSAAFLIAGPIGGEEFATLIFLFPALTLVAALPLTPLGLGIGQLAMGEGFALFGLPADVGVTIATLSQLTQALVAVSIGGYLSMTPQPATSARSLRDGVRSAG